MKINMDTFKTDFIMEVVNLVEEYKEYAIKAGYIVETVSGGYGFEHEGCSNITEKISSMFFNAINSLQLYLEEYGLIMDDGFDIKSDSINIVATLDLAQKLTPVALIKTFAENHVAIGTVRDVLESDEFDPDTTICEIIEALHKEFELSGEYNVLYEHRYSFLNDPEYIVKLRPVVDFTYDRLKDPTTLVDYILTISNHRNKVKTVCNKLAKYMDIPLVEPLQGDVFDTWDADLVDMDPSYILLYGAGNPSDANGLDDIDFMKEHKQRSFHHFEHYKHTKNITMMETLAIFADAYDPEDHENSSKRIMDKAIEMEFSQEVRIRLLGFLENIQDALYR